jgi:hypothetical protein
MAPCRNDDIDTLDERCHLLLPTNLGSLRIEAAKKHKDYSNSTELTRIIIVITFWADAEDGIYSPIKVRDQGLYYSPTLCSHKLISHS